MSSLLPFAMILITLALGLYTFGVFREVRRKYLTGSDVAYFAGGFLFDASGTAVMTWMGLHGSSLLSPTMSTFMAITGSIALGLMLLHLSVALYCIKQTKHLTTFHRFSLAVWSFWLISYAAGPLGLMSR